MKRLLLPFCALLTCASLAAEPVALGRDGVLWRLSATSSGALLVGTKDGEEVARSLVPFPLGVSGQQDLNLQLFADDTTGKVVLAWQRQWADKYSDVMLAVWNGSDWERVSYLTGNPSAGARNPVLRLATVTSTIQNPEKPEEQVTVTDSFALVLFWQGYDAQQQAKLAFLDLRAPAEDGVLQILDVPTTLGLGIGCSQTLPPEAVEHPLFAAEAPGPVAHILVASPSTCLLFLHELRLQQEPPPEGSNSQEGLGAVAQRRRHTPIFGVRRVFPVPREMGEEGTRVVLGASLQPVLYRVRPEGVEYTLATDTGWTPRRTLKLEEGLALDKAISLVENLAR